VSSRDGQPTGNSAAGASQGTPDGHVSEERPAAGGLEPFRARLDALDEQIARLLGERFDVCREVALHKREHDIPMMQPERVIAVRERYQERGAEVNLPPEFTAALFELLIGATCKLEDELIDAPAGAGDGGANR
jgi:4-amino-4-deoxychorismate mutase